MIEVLEWLTDVMRSRGKEQRIALRQVPRRVWNLNHLFSQPEYSAARGLLRAETSFQVPDWTQSVRDLTVASTGTVTLYFDTEGYDFNASASAILWNSPSSFEVVLVDAVTDGSVTISGVTATRSNSRLLPLLVAQAPEGLTVSRPAGRWSSGSVAMNLVTDVVVSAEEYPQYRDHDVLTVCPVVGNGQLEEGVIWPQDVVDNATSITAYVRRRSVPDESFMVRWHVFTKPALAALRQWLYSRMGRQRSFWASTFANDFEVAATIGASDTSITVFAPAGVSNLGRTEFDIDVRSAAGVSYYRQVSDVQASAPISGRATLQLDLTASLGISLTPAAVRRISYFRHARFSADRIELLHRAGAGCAVAVPCLEVPLQ